MKQGQLLRLIRKQNQALRNEHKARRRRTRRKWGTVFIRLVCREVRQLALKPEPAKP